MKAWEELEDFFTQEWGMRSFTQAELAEAMNISRKKATQYIQAYLRAQRNPSENTACVLRRKGRTRSTVWHMGHTLKDARCLAEQTTDDLRIKVEGTLAPDLVRIAQKNSKVKRKLDAIVNVFVTSIKFLEASLEDL